MPRKKVDAATLRLKARQYLAARDRGKQAYAEADGLLNELIDKLGVGKKLELGAGQGFTITDRFAHKIKVFTPAGCNRFEVEVSQA